MTVASHTETVQNFLEAHNAPAEIRAAFMALSIDAAAHSANVASDPTDAATSCSSTIASGEA
jgi:hypothetical protein